jgi:prepilin-type N-terminal cleavage/methylation domain-containing protein
MRSRFRCPAKSARSSHGQRQTAGRGFTLVELLVVVGILLILAAMTIAAVNFSLTSEKIRGASRQLQSFLEGARDRAIHAKQPRGVRFYVDQTPTTAGGHFCTSMAYIAPTEPWKQGYIRLERPDPGLIPFPPVAAPDGVADAPAILIVRGFGTDWDILNDNELIVSGTTRIKIPGDQDGIWYVVSFWSDTDDTTPDHAYDLEASNQVLILTTPYREPGTTPINQVRAFQGGGPTTYLLELAPSELPNAERVELPRGIAIDLEDNDNPNNPHSDLPFAWHEPPGGGEHPLRLDLMFSPRGTVIGSAASKGLIQFLLRRLEDVEFGVPADARSWTASTSYVLGDWVVPSPRDGYCYKVTSAGTSGGAQPTWVKQVGQTTTDGSVTWTCFDVGDRLLVSVFTQTGAISSHPVYEVSSGIPDPYRHSVRGEVAAQ